MLKIAFTVQMLLSDRLGNITLPFLFFTHGGNSARLKFVLTLYEVMRPLCFQLHRMI